MSKFHNRLVATAATSITCAALLVGCGATEPGVNTATGTAEVGGMQLERNPAELSFLSDVVVIATAGEVSSQPFTANSMIPVEAQNEIGYEDGTFARSVVRVEETLKGLPREEIGVAWLRSLTTADGSVAVIEGDHNVELVPGERYVLFLSRGTKLWTGYHIPLGVQGVGVIEGADVRFLSDKTMPLADVVSGAKTPTAPPTETAPPGK